MTAKLTKIFVSLTLILLSGCLDSPKEIEERSDHNTASDEIPSQSAENEDIEVDDAWVIEYSYYQDFTINQQAFSEWFKVKMYNCYLVLPYTFMPTQIYHATWLEVKINPSPAELEQKKQQFESMFADENSTLSAGLSGCRYYKIDHHYEGPWVVKYYETYPNYHTENPDFQKWLLESQSKGLDCTVYHNINGVWTGQECNSVEELDKYYQSQKCGIIQWTEVIEQATFSDMENLRRQFSSFVDQKDYYKCGVFRLDYTPMNIDSIE